jgi:alpha-tubulin suppressor-like RCC1 family protein
MRIILKSGLVLLLLEAVPAQAATTVTNIAAGVGHSLFVKSDGSLWGMGRESYGQLGDGTFVNTVKTPEQIVPSGVTAIAAGEYHIW